MGGLCWNKQYGWNMLEVRTSYRRILNFSLLMMLTISSLVHSTRSSDGLRSSKEVGKIQAQIGLMSSRQRGHFGRGLVYTHLPMIPPPLLDETHVVSFSFYFLSLSYDALLSCIPGQNEIFSHNDTMHASVLASKPVRQ